MEPLKGEVSLKGKQPTLNHHWRPVVASFHDTAQEDRDVSDVTVFEHN